MAAGIVNIYVLFSKNRREIVTIQKKIGDRRQFDLTKPLEGRRQYGEIWL
jgi:hypothetical protein